MRFNIFGHTVETRVVDLNKFVSLFGTTFQSSISIIQYHSPLGEQYHPPKHKNNKMSLH